MHEDTLKRFLVQNRTLVVGLQAFLAVVVAGLLGYYGWIYYARGVEEGIAKSINGVQQRYDGIFAVPQEEVLERAEKEAKLIELVALSSDFYAIYEANSKKANGIRALFHAATTLLEADEAMRSLKIEAKEIAITDVSKINSTAKDYLEKIVEAKAAHTPHALFLLAQMYEDAGESDVALQYLNQLDESYSKSFLRGEGALMRARVLIAKKSYFEAYASIQTALEDETLSEYHPLLRVEASFLSSTGFAAPTSDTSVEKVLQLDVEQPSEQ